MSKIDFKKYFLNIVVLIAALVFMFVLLEVGLRVVFPQTLSIAQFDSRYGLDMKPNVEIMFYNKQLTREFGHSVRTNNDGLREDKDYGLEKEKFRIISMGDSFTFGNGVESEKTFSKLLESGLGDGVEVINFGVSGIEPSHYYKRLEHKALAYNPDLVLVNLFVGNDFGSEIETVNFVPVIPNQLPYIAASKSHAFKFMYVLVDVYGRNILSREKRDLPIIYQPNERYEKIVRSFESALPEFERLAYENDFEIMYVIIPSREQVDDIKWEGLLAERVEVEEPQRFAIQNDVTLALEKSGSKYVDLTPYFVRLNENNSFYYNVDGHLNTKGHELAAAVIERKLQGIIG